MPEEVFFVTTCCTPRGLNQLCLPEVGAAVFETVKHRHDRLEWFARLVVLMPDHLHALLSFPADQAMARRLGIVWQRDFFDHRIRNDEYWMLKAEYIRQNPVRAGLVADAKRWPYVWEPA